MGNEHRYPLVLWEWGPGGGGGWTASREGVTAALACSGGALHGMISYVRDGTVVFVFRTLSHSTDAVLQIW